MSVGAPGLPRSGGQGCGRAAADHPALGSQEEEGGPGIPASVPPAGPRKAGAGLCGLREIVINTSSSS